MLKRYPLLRRALLVLLIYFFFHAAVLQLRATEHYKNTVSLWPRTNATLISATVNWSKYSWSTPRHCPKLEYKYKVGDNSYNGHNEVFDFSCWPDAYDFVAAHKPGTSIEIAYDPDNPNVSVAPATVRDPGYPWGDLVAGIVVLVILGLDFLGAFWRERPSDSFEAAQQ